MVVATLRFFSSQTYSWDELLFITAREINAHYNSWKKGRKVNKIFNCRQKGTRMLWSDCIVAFVMIQMENGMQT